MSKQVLIRKGTSTSDHGATILQVQSVYNHNTSAANQTSFLFTLSFLKRKKRYLVDQLVFLSSSFYALNQEEEIY